jgi:hypothetical protein
VSHDERIAQTLAAFEAAMDRFTARVSAVPADQAQRPGPDGEWSVAQITWHVAVTNEGFAGLVNGTRPLARAPEPEFVETPFGDIQAIIPDKLEAPDMFQPPADATMADVLPRLNASRAAFVDAYTALAEERAGWTIKSILGLLTLYQVGDWAAAHVARHNAQAKRRLGPSS